MKNRDKLSKSIKDDYSITPNALRDLNISFDVMGFYVYLMSLPETFNPSIGHITNKFKIGKTKVRNMFDILETCGIIKKIDKGNFFKKTITKYEFRPKSEWKKYEDS